MFIALICFVKTVLDYSHKNVFRKKTRDHERASKKPRKKKARYKSAKKLPKTAGKGMLDTATTRRIDEYDGAVISRISDYNSNTYDKNDATTMYSIDERNLSYVSSILSQDADFIQDTSDYQWFPDYSLRGNNNGTCNTMHTSILSSLCSSYGYNDMARDLDANLAQVDMEDFRTEDIHSLLHGLPQICGTDAHEDSNASFYKSEILFSPVKEMPLVSFSIDSLDCGEHDIMLTCQANKDNYTIAFEGSTVMDKSTDSRCPINENVANQTENKSAESVERMSLDTTSSENSISGNQVDKALICSESPYTTWSKLKVDSAENVLKRQSSGNNNTNAFSSSNGYANLSASCAFLKSQSLPNLNPVKRQFLLSRRMNHSMKQEQLNHQVTQPNQYVKIYNLSKSQCGRKIHRSVFQNNVNFDLISRFISQKHTANSAATSDDWLGRFSRTVDNLNQSTNPLVGVEENKGCDVFPDSLVHDRTASNAFAVSGSCSSFSSHSGRLDASKGGPGRATETRDIGLPSDGADVRCSEFMRNKYFESANREQKKRRVGRRDPVKIMDRSMQTSSSDADSAISPPTAADDGSATKPVYVMYPNYTLPDLSFLKKHATELDLNNVFLWPQKFSPSPTTEHAAVFSQPEQREEREETKRKRPCSCPDLETIRNRDYQHVRDWESLMFLLPREYSKILTEDPEIRKCVENVDDLGRSLICTSALCDAQEQHVDIEACSATQPSSGYRGSSTMLSTGSNYENGKYVSNRPPLPRGILRNPVVQNIKSKKPNAKRYSMFELSREEAQMATEKRRSLPTQFKDSVSKRPSETEGSYSEDEGVHSSGSHCDSPGPHSELEAKRLESLLETVFHWNETDASQLKIQNSKKTVSFAEHHNCTPPNSPICSVTGQQRSPYQMKLHATLDGAIHEECELDTHDLCNRRAAEPRTNSYNFKKELMDAVDEAVKGITEVGDCEESMAQIALDRLCPALYAVLNHGLKPTLETAFGDINNSVWQVVEASSQQGLMTRALHEMVLRLNNEDVLTEGLLKFNAFVFGLLNVRGLDTWFSYLRTRESVLRKHYVDTGILLSSCRGIMSDKQLTDQLVTSLKPLADLAFRLDLLYECRQLHNSLMQLGQNVLPSSTRTSWMLKKIVRSLQNQKEKNCDESIDDDETFRPRSCVDSSNGFAVNDVASTVRKRWSGIQFGSKLASAFERLAVDDDETYTDSLDHAVNRRNDSVEVDVACSNTLTDLSSKSSEQTGEEHRFPVGELKFKQLQKKWEMLAEKNSPPDTLSSRDTFSSRTADESIVTLSSTKSRIPRLVTSPVRPPSGLHFSTLSAGKIGSQLKLQSSPTSPCSGLPTKKIQSPIGNKRVESSLSKIARTKSTSVEDGSVSSTHSARANSSSVRRPSSSSRIQQRKVTDTLRRPTTSSRYANITSKYVRTLGHRLPSDTGHLSYNDGEKLRVVLEVDDKWILCCRGDQKGLVPRSAVLPISEHL